MGIFDEVVRKLLSDPRVSQAAMFGHPAVKIGGRVFAMEFEGEMVVKVGIKRVEDLVTSGQAQRFHHIFDRRRPMREWARVPAAGANLIARWTVLAREAELFVSEEVLGYTPEL
jgi:hypothetical protein